MNLTFRRNYWLLIVLAAVFTACIAFGSTRIIAYNFGKNGETISEGTNYENDVYLFDDSVVHEIEIDLSQEDYEDMVAIYQASGDKEYFKTDITIDGCLVPNIGIRLKGNLTLSQSLGGRMGNMPGGMPNENGEGQQAFRERNNFEIPEGLLADLQAAGLEAPSDEEMQEMFGNPRGMGREGMPMPPGMELPENWEEMTQEEQRAFMEENGPAGFGGDPMGMGGEGNGNNPPYLIKFDEFIPGQTYQGLAEIAIRLGSDTSLLGEPVVYHIHEAAGQIVPETAYAVVQTAELEPSLYVVCEHPDEKYIEKNLSSSDGVLYKAGNFVGFQYQGEDPTLYANMFEQKTNINDDDLAPLIRFMKFVSESSDEEFEEELPNWLDLPSLIRMMALDNLLDNNDSFVGMGSNYYLYYNKATEQFTMLSWDMNLAMGSMGGMMQSRAPENGAPRFGFEEVDTKELTESEAQRQEIFEKWLEEGGFGGGGGPGGPGGRGNTNTLKERFFVNETFSDMYDEQYAKLKALIFTESTAAKKAMELSQTFSDYNQEHQILDQETYNTGVERILNFLEQKESEFK
ncbi:CotH kinase family protein [Patescibacteria group bacterium]|nr:CotH kinase family protein [Patescibacteria group bacterium]MBU1682866.1 CotH kinase family protein [Patescibacteria group bacterium]MBU1934720.1 CotH kinase family protein [Patescibacteria group bacterium]